MKSFRKIGPIYCGDSRGFGKRRLGVVSEEPQTAASRFHFDFGYLYYRTIILFSHGGVVGFVVWIEINVLQIELRMDILVNADVKDWIEGASGRGKYVIISAIIKVMGGRRDIKTKSAPEDSGSVWLLG
jgi:hypothetical protein